MKKLDVLSLAGRAQRCQGERTAAGAWLVNGAVVWEDYVDLETRGCVSQRRSEGVEEQREAYLVRAIAMQALAFVLQT
jgi:hypothetical protein